MRGLYIHLPFCLKKCDYCDFASYEDAYEKEALYLDALLSEFQAFSGEKVHTVYLGGGTPTSLKTETLIELLSGVFRNFQVANDAEITIECNPKTADEEKLRALLDNGVNRISIGVQSFKNSELSAVGRIHSGEDAIACIQMAHKAGFRNISADLMFGLPGQTLESLENNINRMASLPLNHISCYGLILEEGTPLQKKAEQKGIDLPDEDTEFLMYQTIVRRLKEFGFSQYEISNFAKEGFCSHHNINYWRCGEYFGCGAAAHGFVNGVRYSHPSSLDTYLKNPLAYEETTKITPEDAMSEFMMLGLRMTDGVSEKTFFEKFGVNVTKKYNDAILKYERMGLLRRQNGRLFFTEQGIYVSNAVLCEFM